MSTLDELFPSKYLKAADVAESDLDVTIKSIGRETMKNKETGEDENKPILFFEETKKGIVLNKTNAKQIIKLHGEKENWIGKKITLFSTEVDAFGETTEAIRVRSKAPGNAIPADPTEGLYANTSHLAPATLAKWTALVKDAMGLGVVMNFSLDETDTPDVLTDRVQGVKVAVAAAQKKLEDIF